MAEKKESVVCSITLWGCAPCMMDPMSPEVLESIRTKTPMAKTHDVSAFDIAKGKIIRNPDTRRIGFPAEYLIGALVEAGRSVKIGKEQISTAKSTMLFSFLSFDEMFFDFQHIPDTVLPESEDEKKYWKPDMRRGVSDQTGVVNAIIRPKFENGWELVVKPTIDLTIASDTRIVRQLFEIAGRKVGLGSFRPAHRGPFGRFLVKSFEEVDNNTQS